MTESLLVKQGFDQSRQWHEWISSIQHSQLSFEQANNVMFARWVASDDAKSRANRPWKKSKEDEFGMSIHHSRLKSNGKTMFWPNMTKTCMSITQQSQVLQKQTKVHQLNKLLEMILD